MIPWSYRAGVSFEEMWKEQETLRQEILAGNASGHLFIVEHPPTISLGRGEKGANLLFDPELLRSRGLDVVETNRGGKVTYHGPGQLVAYPVVDLRFFGGVKSFVCRLEEAMIRTLAAYEIEAARREGYPGVWANGRKIGSVGIHVRRQVSIHGLALNVCCDLNHFDVITPCGIPGVTMTSMKHEGVDLNVEGILPTFVDLFAETLGRACA